MKPIKTLFNFYINSSIHVALAVYAFSRITELYFDLPYNEELDYFIFYGTITGYNFVKYAPIAKLHHRSLTKNLKLIQIFSLICFVLMLYYGTKLTLNSLLFFVPFILLTFFYAVPVLTKNLRNISSLKILIIALVWAGVTVLLPLINSNQEVTINVILSFLQRLLLVVALTLPFDIRDLQFDNKTLKTIPQRIGIERTKKLGFVLLGICLVIEFIITPNSQFRNVFLIISGVLFFLLMRSKISQSKFYSSFFVESLPIVWWLLLLVNS